MMKIYKLRESVTPTFRFPTSFFIYPVPYWYIYHLYIYLKLDYYLYLFRVVSLLRVLVELGGIPLQSITETRGTCMLFVINDLV